MKINERIKVLRHALGDNQTEFASKLGIGKSTIAMMEVSKRPIAERHIKTICSICNVREDWLRYGEGEMFNAVNDNVIENVIEEYGLSEMQAKLLRLYADLPDDARETVATSFFNIIGAVQTVPPSLSAEETKAIEDELAALDERRATLAAKLSKADV